MKIYYERKHFYNKSTADGFKRPVYKIIYGIILKVFRKTQNLRIKISKLKYSQGSYIMKQY